jgi:hypothetical protein
LNREEEAEGFEAAEAAMHAAQVIVSLCHHGRRFGIAAYNELSNQLQFDEVAVSCGRRCLSRDPKKC